MFCLFGLPSNGFVPVSMFRARAYAMQCGYDRVKYLLVWSRIYVSHYLYSCIQYLLVYVVAVVAAAVVIFVFVNFMPLLQSISLCFNESKNLHHKRLIAIH